MRHFSGLFMLFMVLSLSACRGRADSASSEPAPPVAAAPAARSPTAAQAPAEQRKITRTAILVLDVADLDVARQEAIALIEQRKGFVASLSGGHAQNDELRTVHLILRVPTDNFEQVLRALRRLALTVRDERVSAEDVTGSYVDLSARLVAKRKLEQRLLALLGDTKNVKDALEVERELAGIRTEIEQLEAQRALLESQSALATINVTLQREQASVVTSFSSISSSFERARVDALNLAGAIVTAGIRIAGIAIPTTLLIGIPLLGCVWLARRFNKRRALRRLASMDV